MAELLVYYAHPGHNKSRVNRRMLEAALCIDNIQVIDLYARYPRHNIDIDAEQQRLLAHDIVVFQFPFFWYSTPSLIKEWCDLVLEYGFAYGPGGTQLQGKFMLLAITAASPEAAYSTDGYQRYPVRTLLTPMERTAKLCGMQFIAPYMLFDSLHAAEDQRGNQHVSGYRRLLEALKSDQLDLAAAQSMDTISETELSKLISACP